MNINFLGNRKMKLRYTILLLIFSLTIITSNAAEVSDFMKKGLTYNITDDGTNYIKFSAATQMWVRYSELNSGVVDHLNKPIKNDFDFLLRRNYASINARYDRFSFFIMGAMTTQDVSKSTSPFVTSKTAFFLYDAWGSYQLVDKYLLVGGGLSMWGASSRYNAASSGATLGADVPIFTAPNLLTDNQDARRMGLFFAGSAGIIDYRFAISKPFISNTMPSNFGINDTIRFYDYPNYNWAYSGAITFQFFDKEAPNLPFYTSCYLGDKKVFNIGFGADFHKEAVMRYNNDGSHNISDKLHLSADLFYDRPLANKSAVNLYLGYFLNDFGENYLQSFGISEIWGKGSVTEPQIGSGSVLYSQVGYVLPNNLTLGNGKIQPFATYALKKYKNLNENINQFSAGINYYFYGHKTKFTLEYMNRPEINISNNIEKYRSTIIGKLQIGI